jgi:hypothetical protein
MNRFSYLAKMSKEYGIKVSINKAGELGYKVSAKSAQQPGSRRAAGEWVMLKDASEVPSFK